MNKNKLSLTTLEYGSLLSYSPRDETDLAKQSRTAMHNLKNNAYVPEYNVPMVEYVSNLLKENFQTLTIAKLFEANPILVPVPKSSLMKGSPLWVPKLLAIAINKKGLGKEVSDCIKRISPLRKSSTSLSKDRPKAYDHCCSIGVQKTLLFDPKEILLVDDIITRGATMLGAANRILMEFPNVKIRAFAAIRTVTPPDEFTDFFQSCLGKITLSNDNTFRRP